MVVILLIEPPLEDDAERNTDLTVLRLDSVRIGCRVRKFKYLKDYGHEFTIRAGRPNGTKTELTKIIEGWGDYFFYGFADEQEKELARWILGDLKVLRLYISRLIALKGKALDGIIKNNHDNSSSFIVFRYADIPGFVIASKDD